MMMINFTLLLFFNLIFIFSSGKCVSSCIYKAVGERVEIPLDIGELPEENHLIWTHNEKRVYNKKGSNAKTGEFDVDRTGSLILENIQKKHSGKYEGELYDANGNFITKITHQLCVQEPVPEPTVTFECVEKGVNLSCSPVTSSEVSVSWMRNGETSNTTRAVLHVSWSELKPGDVFSCTHTNMISSTSASVQPGCSGTGASEDNQRKKEKNNNNKNQNDATKLLFGLDFWWMLVILTAGVSLLLILFIICLVCVCRCSARNKRKAKEEAEFRLISLMPDHTDQPDVQYMQKTGSHRSSKSMRPLPPLPSPRGLQPQ